MGKVTVAGHKVYYIDQLHINPETFTSNPGVAMVAPMGLGVMSFLTSFIGAAGYHFYPLSRLWDINTPQLSFSSLANDGGKVGAIVGPLLICTDGVIKHGILKTAADLYDATLFSIEAWPQVLFNEFCDYTPNHCGLRGMTNPEVCDH